jgi:transketolase
VRGRDIRRIVLDQSRRAGVGHIGSALCVADILAALYSGVLRMPSPEDPERDRFILSKGHAALALYAALHLRGWVSHRQLDTFCGEDTLLGAHPERGLCGVDFSTGSLGHGLSVGAGAALAARLDGSPRRTFVLVSDAECNEGSLWEAAMFAAHHRLASLVAVVDLNGQQALGPTAGILDTAPLAARWAAFGWDTHEVDGHDADALAVAATQLDTTAGAPHVLVARTVFGRGVSFMERQHRWHYLPMSEAEYARALAEVEAMP